MSGRYRILLVDDNDLNRALARSVIARSAHPVASMITLVEADTLAAARAALEGEPVDAILLDMRLPDGHGTSLSAELAQRDDRPAIIAVTASVLPENESAVRAAGCDDFLAKPYSPQQLIDALVANLKPPSDTEIGPRS